MWHRRVRSQAGRAGRRAIRARFRDVPGLVQKYYSYDESTGEWAGIYLWDTEDSLAAYLASDLRKTIPTAYELTEPPRIERYPIVDVLR